MWRLLPVVPAVLLLGCGGGENGERSTASPSASASPARTQEAGVDCSKARVKVLARKGASAGTAVFVFNIAEQAGPDAADEIARGAADGLRGTGRERAPIDIGGRAGTLVEAADGAFIAISPAGRCSFAVLIADTERMLRDGAALIPSS